MIDEARAARKAALAFRQKQQPRVVPASDSRAKLDSGTEARAGSFRLLCG